jgi:hypothetical protein
MPIPPISISSYLVVVCASLALSNVDAVVTPSTDVSWEDTNPDSYCQEVNNLGEGYSSAIGFNGTFPKTSVTGLTPRGTDDSISFLVGGNYLAPAAAEIEGKAVVLGDFIIGSQGTNSIGKHTSS